MHRTRRSVLAGVGAALSGALAGCAGDSADELPASPGSATGSERSVTEPGLSLVAVDFTSLDASCGTGRNTAEITFDPPRIRVEGVVGGADGCQVAVLEGAATEAGTFRVTVGTQAGATGASATARACAQCLVDIPYEGTFEFEERLPERVMVAHESPTLSGSNRVRTAER